MKDPVFEDQSQSVLQEEYLKSLEELEEGQLVEGTVIEVSPENVFIDVGYKSEGKIPRIEFDEEPKIGDSVSVVLIKKEGKRGEVIVSKQKADLQVFWKTLKNAVDNHEPVNGVVKKSIKGGYEVDLGNGITAFCPLSQIDVYRVEEPESMIGIKDLFAVERFQRDKQRARIVVSRRSYLEKAIEEKRNVFFLERKEGDIVSGVVKSFTSFGAFIDLGGFDGLLHINDMSWGHVTRPKDYVSKGQEIEVKIVKIDRDEQKINLSLKDFSDDPWSNFEDKFSVEDVVKGTVTKLADFGAFIEISEGIEGLAHISELSWVKRIKHPKEVLSIGDEVETKILGYDLDERKVSLGIKQVLPNPWENLSQTYPVGMRLKKTVKKITNAGAFIELEDGIDGFLHADDLSWTKRIKNPSSVLKEGQEIEVVVTEIDPETKRIRLGVKQLEDDPWQQLKNGFPKGAEIEGEITGITDFGVFAKVQGDIEGLIPKSQLFAPGEEDEEFADKFKIGDKLKVVILDINKENQRLSLSIKELHKKQQRSELSKYIHDEDESGTFTLGNMLKDKGVEKID